VLRRGVLEGSLKVVESGNDLPVIDLSQVRRRKVWWLAGA
jgi:hypothetical protein